MKTTQRDANTARWL